jgi:hemolysin III
MPSDESRIDLVYTRGERIADAAIHAIGVTAGSVGAVGLLIVALRHGAAAMVIALGLYAFGLVAMLSLSAAYNLVTAPVLKERLRAADHAAIYVMIAGTYSPVAMVVLDPTHGWSLFAFMWSAAIGGAALKLVWPRRFERLSIVAYILLGWTFVWLWTPMHTAIAPTGLMLLGLGGVLYTAGVGFHLAHRLRYHNALWHAFVLAAAACHYAMILLYVAMPAVG